MASLFEDFQINFTEMLGFAGGVLLALNLMPQLVKSVRERSTKDISYSYQLIYMIGLWMNLGYVVLIRAVAAWMTLVVEMIVAHTLLILKIQYDGCSKEDWNCFKAVPEEDEDFLDYDPSMDPYHPQMAQIGNDDFYYEESGFGSAYDSLDSSAVHALVWEEDSRGFSVYDDMDDATAYAMKSNRSLGASSSNAGQSSRTLDAGSGHGDTATTTTNSTGTASAASVLGAALGKELLEDVCRRGYHYAIDAAFMSNGRHGISLDFGRLLLGVILEAAEQYQVRVIHSTLETFRDEDYGPFEFSPSYPGFAFTIITSNSQIIAHCNTGTIMDEEESERIEESENSGADGTGREDDPHMERPGLQFLGKSLADFDDDMGSITIDCFIRGGTGKDRGGAVNATTSAEAGCRMIMEKALEFLQISLGSEANVKFYHIQRFRPVSRPVRKQASSGLDYLASSLHDRISLNLAPLTKSTKTISKKNVARTLSTSSFGSNASSTVVAANNTAYVPETPPKPKSPAPTRNAKSSVDLELGTIHSEEASDLFDEMLEQDEPHRSHAFEGSINSLQRDDSESVFA